MIGILALLAASWALLWWFEKGNLSALGWEPTAGRLKPAAILFLTTAACCSTAFFMRSWFTAEQFVLNPAADTARVLSGLWQNIRSVLTEELLCRGVGLYILIKKLGQKRAIVISSVVFGLLHWMNAGVLGNPVQMALIFSFTFTMGLLLAYAYAKSFSLYWPLAIHLGWNLVQNFVFPDGPFGFSLLITALPQQEVTVSYFVYFMMILFPKISAIGIGYLLVRYFGRQRVHSAHLP